MNLCKLSHKITSIKNKKEVINIEELAYSFHLGNDKNKSKKSKNSMKNKNFEDTIFNNNAIQNAQMLSKVNKHNLRKYENNSELIEIIYGSNNLYSDVKKLYNLEFEKARIEYNDKQKRCDRKIENYFEHISNNSKNDLACEIIIELGDMYFWQDKDEDFKKKMIDVYKEQRKDLEELVPSFKIANAVIHFDESSPHLHIVGVPVKNGNKNGMSKQVGKSDVFTKESLTMIQDVMREKCITSFNKIYQTDNKLKLKLKGRNLDIQTKDMKTNYNILKQQADKNRKRLDDVNKKTALTLENSKKIKEIISNLKPTKMSKNNYFINENQIETINNYIDDVDVNVSGIKNIDDLTVLMNDFEKNIKEHNDDIKDLRSLVENQAKKITSLEKQNIKKQDTIIEQKNEIKSLKKEISQLEKIIEAWQNLWQKILDFFREKLFTSKKSNDTYSEIIDDLSNENIITKEEIDYIMEDSIEDKNNDLEL